MEQDPLRQKSLRHWWQPGSRSRVRRQRHAEPDRHLCAVGHLLCLRRHARGGPYRFGHARTYNFALNRVADITVRAPKTVEDTERTEELRQHARSRVSDVRLYSPEVKNQQVDLLNQYFSFVKGVRQKDYRASDLESAARAQGWSDNDLETLKASFTSNSQRLYWTQLTEAERLLLYNQSLKQGSVALMSLNESLPDNARNL